MSMQRINIKEAKDIISKGANIADIRDALSFQASHIRGAKRLDNNNLNEFMAAADKSAPLIIYCYSGNSSQSAAQFFASQGYEQVYSLDGGFGQWQLMYPDLCV